MPMREVRARFTKSELAILAWRSAEIGAKMKAKTNSVPNPAHNRFNIPFVPRQSVIEDARIARIEEQLGDLGDKITDADGEVDLRRLTGPEALRFFSALGISFGRH